MNRLIDPVVSVILAVNKDDGFLDVAINSILKQTLQNFELIIVANKCDDSLWEYLNTFADPRIRCIRSNIGQLPYSLNLGIDLARSEFIARMDADDISLPDRLATQYQFMINNPNISVLGANYLHIDNNENIIGAPSKLYLDPVAIMKRLAYESCIPHPTAFMRRADILSVGGYAYGFYAEDWDLWSRLANSGFQLCNLDKILLYYRIHNQQSTSSDKIRRNIAYVSGIYARELIYKFRPRMILGYFSFICNSMFFLIISKIKKFYE